MHEPGDVFTSWKMNSLVHFIHPENVVCKSNRVLPEDKMREVLFEIDTQFSDGYRRDFFFFSSIDLRMRKIKEQVKYEIFFFVWYRKMRRK